MNERPPEVKPDLVSQMEFLSWSQVRISQGRPGDVLQGLETLRSAAEAAGWLKLRLDATALLALAWKSAGEVQKSLAALEEALSLAEPEGYVAVFTDLGPPMGWLFAEATRRTSTASLACRAMRLDFWPHSAFKLTRSSRLSISFRRRSAK